MSLHCRCWKDDAEPCCWCLDDTEDSADGPDLPACTRHRDADCVADLREMADDAERDWFDAINAKRAKP